MVGFTGPVLMHTEIQCLNNLRQAEFKIVSFTRVIN